MQAIDQMIASLQEQILNLDATAETSGQELITTIIKSQELLQALTPLAKGLNNNLLIDFLVANMVILKRLQQVAETPDESNILLTKSTEITQQIAHIYQNSLVPMLTRLHNLSVDTDDMQKITAITSLGNEIITCSSQINQFNEKFNVTEKSFTMLGIVLMLSSISIMIAILSKPSNKLPLLNALTIMALGCSLCRKAMQPHFTDPSTDLIVTSVKKMEPLIYDIVKHDTKDHEYLKAILHADNNVEPTPIPTPTQQRKTTPISEETEAIPTVTFMGKLKGVLDIFNTKK